MYVPVETYDCSLYDQIYYQIVFFVLYLPTFKYLPIILQHTEMNKVYKSIKIYLV